MKLDSTNAFLTVVSLAMFSVTSVLVGLLVCIPSDAPALECDPNLLEPQCPDGATCNEFGRCIGADIVEEETPIVECEIGQHTSTCRCPDHLDVRDGVCVEPASNEACEHHDVAQILTRLDHACSDERATAPGRLGACERTALDDVILESHRDTLKIARLFRGQSFTLHFERGTPASSATRWPSAAEQQPMLKHVKGMLETIEPRGYVLLVALASATGTRQVNYKLAAHRSDAAVLLLGKARRAFPELAERLADVGLLVGLIGYEQHAALNLATFDEIWGATGRYRGWDEASTRRMTSALTAWRAGSLARAELEWLTRTVNQSVLVIPLPCQPPPRKDHE